MKILTETKAEKLAKLLRTRIVRAGSTSTDTTISEAQLVRDFGVGRSTVREALSILKTENLLIRNPGRRTVVLTRRVSQRVAFILCNDEHTNLFATSPLAKALTNLGAHLSLLHQETLAVSQPQPPPDTIVFYHSVFIGDGPCRRMLASVRAAYPDARIVGILLGDCAPDLARHRIKLDMAAANADLARKLLEERHRRFLCIGSTEFKPHDPPNPVLQGIQDAISTVPDASLRLIDTQKNLRERLVEHFSSKNHATAVVASMDSLANLAIQTLHSLDLRIPEEVAVSGQFNTPWSEQTTPPITSTRIDQPSFQQAIQEVLQGTEEELVVPLRVVWRESTGPLRPEHATRRATPTILPTT